MTNRGGQDAEIPGALSLLLIQALLVSLAGSPQTGEPSGSDSDRTRVSASTVHCWTDTTWCGTGAAHLVESVHRSAGEDHLPGAPRTL